MASSNTSSRSPFLLLFRNAGPDAHAHLNEQERADLTKRWNDWYGRLEAEGKVSTGAPLALNGRVVTGRVGNVVTDGPYAEAKEIVGGFVILTVANLDEATEIARQVPGLAIDLTVEVRPIAAVSPALEGVKGHA
ncbi:MAG TPA: YciI family protein [Opitutaceae bacterium]|nr:YciI family protein [Opitutaceae bacterium]